MLIYIYNIYILYYSGYRTVVQVLIHFEIFHILFNFAIQLRLKIYKKTKNSKNVVKERQINSMTEFF